MANPKPRAGVDYPANCEECIGNFGPKMNRIGYEVQYCPYVEHVGEKASENYPNLVAEAMKVEGDVPIIACKKGLEVKVDSEEGEKGMGAQPFSPQMEKLH